MILRLTRRGERFPPAAIMPFDISSLGTRWRVPLLVAGLIAITLLAAWQVRRGVAPDSLWLDDQWVAALVRHASPAELLELRPPVPVGFVLLQQVSVKMLGWGHWQLQFLPLLAALAQVPLLGWIAFRLTGRVSLGLTAALLLTGSRTLWVYSLRVKQFSWEGVIVLGLIALALLCLRRLNPLTFLSLVAAALLALPCSFTALPVGWLIINLLTLHALRLPSQQRSLSKRQIWTGCLTYNLLALAWLLLFQVHQSNEVMIDFWHAHYLPLDDPASTWTFLTTQLPRFLTGALPDTLAWLTWAVPLSVALLIWRRPTRLAGLGLLLFYAGMLTASALHLYPLGGRRTDIFSYPITILAIIGVIWIIGRWIRWIPAIMLLLVTIDLALFFPPHAVVYPAASAREAVTVAGNVLAEDDALIVALRSNWATGCYGDWPVELIETASSSNGFMVLMQRPRTLTMEERVDGTDSRFDPSVTEAQLESFLQEAPERVVLLSIGHYPPADDWIIGALTARGYQPHALAVSEPARVIEFTRESP